MRPLYHRSTGITLFGLVSVLLLGFLPHAFAFSTGEAATLVIGDPSLTAFNPGATSTGLVGPFALAFDSSHNLWVADSYGNRILEYKAPFSTDEAASIVIGQSNFTGLGSATTSTGLSTPNGLAFDSGGNLWVSDSSNNRILEYRAPLSTGEAASIVIGQSNFTGSGERTTATGLDNPYGLTFDSSGNLWVADLQNGRVLEYTAPFSTGEAASLVIGEPNFVTSNDQVSLRGLNAPDAVAFDSSGNLWVADGHRNLEYTAPLSTHEPASMVIGQNNFTNSSTVTTSAGMDGPGDLAFDSSGNLWVSDGHRVLEYTAPLSTHEPASMVIGQNNFTNSSTVTTSAGMNGPGDLAFDSSGNLWVSDTDNNRVLEYQAPFSTYEAASLVIGQPNFTSAAQTPIFSPTAASLNHPQGVAFDSSGNLWVADWAAGRVLEYGGSTSGASSSSSTTSTSTSTTSTTSRSSTTVQSSVTTSSSATTSTTTTSTSTSVASTSSQGSSSSLSTSYLFLLAAQAGVILLMAVVPVGRLRNRKRT